MASSAQVLSLGVLGAGSWGSALALHAARRGVRTRLWARSESLADSMRESGINERYLPEHPLGAVEVTSDMASAVEDVDALIVAVPSHAFRNIVRELAELFKDRVGGPPLLLIAAKGIEADSTCTMAQVVEEELGPASLGTTAALGGPSFAKEVAAGLPTAVVVASAEYGAAESFQSALSGDGLRVYVTRDVTGVELGGAVKNVVALAAGICDGAGLGLNARAALITRGLAEVGRLATELGADPRTLAGLAGLGDLILTCTGELSRNRRVGFELGRGRALDDILEDMGMVAEGVKNTKSVCRLAEKTGVEMPIAATMHAILYEGASVEDAVERLMQRALRPERDAP